MPALASNGGGNRNKKSSSSSKNSKSSGGNKKSNNKKSGNKKGNKKSNKNKKDKVQEEFENWLSSLFDWVEVRLDRIQRRIDLASTKAENAVGNVATAISNIDAKNQYLNDAMSEIAKSASDISQFNISVDKNSGTITGNAVEGSLLGDSILGALRYQQQANSVMDRAVNKGLLDQALANDIKGKVATGVIDIDEYPEKIRKVIDAYKEWYDKGADLVQQAEELKQQYKDLQQQKLDNITKHFEAWIGLADAIKASSEATVKYYTTIGQAINTKDASEMNKQLGRQQEISSQYLDEYRRYYLEMQNAVHVFGENSIEYKNAQIQLEEINKSLIESRTAEEDLRHGIAELPFTLRAQIIYRIEKTVDKFSSLIQLTEKRGTVRTGASSAYSTNLNSGEFRNLYRDQMRFNNDLIPKYYEDFVARQNQINAEIKSGKLSVDSERYQELYEKLTKDQSAMISLLSTQEDLKESLRTLNWKPYEKWKTSMDKTTNELQHLQSFIREEEMYTKSGEITSRGWANVAIIAEDMNIAESRITEAKEALKKLGEEFNFGTISAEKYEEETTNVYEEIQKQAERLFDAQQKISEMQIEAWTRENDVLQKLIDKRNEALSAKKEYYDYDKQLREKNKDIAQINAQINALAGATDQASQAKRARLQSELKDKQQDLSDTRYDHQVDIQQQGYQKLSEDMKQALDEAVRLIQGDAATLQKTTSRMLAQLQENNINEKDIINGIVADRRTAISQETQNAINNTIGANISYLAYGLGNIASAIGSHSDKSLLQFNAVIETAINSKGENISSKISQIFSQISSINFDQKFKDLEATISKTQKTAASNPAPAAPKPAPAPAPAPAASKPASSAHETEFLAEKMRREELAEKERRRKAAIDDLAARGTRLSAVIKREGKVGRYDFPLYKELDNINSEIKRLGGTVKRDSRGLFASVSYAKGTKKVNKNELAWTNENMDKVGSEMIVRPSDGAILTPLKANDAVIPANLVQNLFKWGAINPDSFAVNPFMGKWGETSGGTKSEMFSNNTSNQSINLSFDSLFHIDGNVDANVVDRLEDLGKSLTKNKEFQQNVINFVTRNYVKESRKQGFR